MNLIVVIDEKNGVGFKNDLLMHLPEDLKYFKAHTIGKVVVMGRLTLESLPGGKPLKDRKTVVVSSTMADDRDDLKVVKSYDELFEYLKQFPTEDVYVAGGAQIYNALLPYCDQAYITKIHKTLEADCFLDFNPEDGWQLAWESELHTHNGTDFHWTHYIKLG